MDTSVSVPSCSLHGHAVLTRASLPLALEYGTTREVFLPRTTYRSYFEEMATVAAVGSLPPPERIRRLMGNYGLQPVQW